MKSERLGGGVMVLAAVMGLVTMAFHPTGHEVAAGGGPKVMLSLVVHALAIASLPLAFYGGLALTRRLGTDLAALALSFYGAGLVAVMVAAVASGFLAAPLIERVMGGEGEPARTMLAYNVSVNQAFAALNVGGLSVGILIWSALLVRGRALGRSVGVLGCVVSVGSLVALFAGLKLDVHGYGAIVLAQAIWQIATGITLRGPGLRGAPASTAVATPG